jgi:hypothetical protein
MAQEEYLQALKNKLEYFKLGAIAVNLKDEPNKVHEVP